MAWVKRFFRAPKDHYFIFGPRGTGKSSWLTEFAPNSICLDLLDNKTYLQCCANPDYLTGLVDANPEVTCFVIDEVQKLPNLLNTVHKLIEAKPQHQFILTASSARKLRKEGVNLLGGRALLTHFHPFMAAELKEKFDLNTTLKHGLLPLVVEAKEPSKKIDAYLALYIKEEVQAEGLVRNLSDFTRFLEMVSFSHGSLLNLTNLARECQVSRKTVENYITILEDLLLGYQLPVFTKRAKRAQISHPKFYLFDAGVYSHLRPQGPLDNPEERHGVALEGLVLQHLKAWCDYSENTSLRCYFWRTRSGSEVDFIVYGEGHFYAIEVKHSNRVYSQDVRSLKAFCEDYPEARSVLLYRGKEKIMVDNILCCPVDQFLLSLVPNRWPLEN